MAAGGLERPSTVAPIASVWCRQVDNEAESPGYTAIPDEFAGRHEALEAIRLVGNLTINVADTHDYWDPNPSQTLSFYPNLFLYPAAGGRYTCIGRMFLSTEDRPRLGMKTLVFSTEELVRTGDFGGAVARAHATMVGRDEPRRPRAEPDASVFQAVGEGFLFHRGTTEPVLVVAASDQWDAVAQSVLELVTAMPTALTALGAFLVFPYFLPAPKVNFREFSETMPLALAVMRVPRQEAEGERHTKRMQSWQSEAISLRDLSRPPTSKAKESLPLVLQYVRDHADEKASEVVRRVDQVEATRLTQTLGDPEAPTGRERRKEMWRIGTAMETAALLLARPRGKTVNVSGEMAKRANEYLEAKPGESPLVTAPPVVPTPAPAAPTRTAPPAAAPTPAAGAPTVPPAAPVASAPPTTPPAAPPPASATGAAGVPQWLRGPTQVTLPPETPGTVPVSTSDDTSLRGAAPRPAPLAPRPSSVTPAAPGGAAPLVTGRPPAAAAPPPVPSSADRGLLDARLSLATRDLERRWAVTLDARLREVGEASARAAEAVRTDLAARLTALEARPAAAAANLGPEVEAQVAAKVDPKIAEIEHRVSEAVKSTAEGWAERFRRDLKEAAEELAARSAKSEEDLRAALVAQLDLELLEAKEQGQALREEVEARVREILDARLTEGEQRRTREMRELEQRVGILVDGRSKDVEEHLVASLGAEAQKLAASADDRVAHVERRLALERDARIAEVNEAQRAAVAGLQVRMQAFVEQMVRENQAAEQEKYIELLARLKAELETTIASLISSAEFNTKLRDRIEQSVETARSEQEVALAATLTASEGRLRSETQEAVGRLETIEHQLDQRGEDLIVLEAKLREELEDIDRRVMVVNDHVLPIVRQTWLKLTENEANAQARPSETQFAELGKELREKLERLEQELEEQTSDLRERLELSIQSHGRIWLNFLRTYSPEAGGFPAPASQGSHRVSKRLRPAALPSASTEPSADASPFAADPPNPMDPELAGETGPKEPRRRARKAG
ncbi:MAG TPA: hypothetical protein VMH49_06555 [Thermoplasmata archaeon]|nr:hypothetical protein [Thermoplasmata archaeon]